MPLHIFVQTARKIFLGIVSHRFSIYVPSFYENDFKKAYTLKIAVSADSERLPRCGAESATRRSDADEAELEFLNTTTAVIGRDSDDFDYAFGGM